MGQPLHLVPPSLFCTPSKRGEGREIVEEERDESKVNICNCTPIQEQYEEQQSKVIKSLLILLTHDECLW